jgi:predicted Zn-ribbon and HTH transcriptional regulator
MARTHRQEIESWLRLGEETVESLARRLRLPVTQVIDDLEHVRCSLRPPDGLRVEPAECEACGFVFHSRARVATPSRCPRCRSERIAPARFRIE